HARSLHDALPISQPISSTRLPDSSLRCLMYSSRSGLISCSGRKSPVGSHHLEASESNFAISAGSTLSGGRGALWCVDCSTCLLNSVSDLRSNAFLPFRASCKDIGFVDRGQASVIDVTPACDPDIADLIRMGSVYEL